MKLTFIGGADHEVTGSCHYVEAGATKFLGGPAAWSRESMCMRTRSFQCPIPISIMCF